MPDWRAGEFEGKFTDEFAQSNRNEHESGIEAPGVTSSKKLKHSVASEKIHQGVISGTDNSDSQKCNSEHIPCANGIVSQNINSTGDCKDGSNAFPLGEENTITETRCPSDNWNSCQFALSNGSAILNNHSAAQDGLTYGDNDLNYIDWPGIDNFEDVDTLFRRSDSTYGQQQLENTDGLSWIPSSDAVYSSDVALQQGFESSYSDYGILDDLSAFQCAEDKSLPSVDPSAALCDNQFNDTYLFSEQKNVNAYGEQASQITFAQDGSIAPRKPTSVAEAARQRELSHTVRTEGDGKVKRQVSSAKSKELSGHDIFADHEDPKPNRSRKSDYSSSTSLSPVKNANVSTFSFGEAETDSTVKTAKKKGTSNKPTDLNGKVTFERVSAPTVKQPLNRPKLEETTGSSVFADGKAPANGDHAGRRTRQPPGGDSSISLA